MAFVVDYAVAINNSNNSLMRFRKLRIAWSVGWGIIAVLLIALWVTSYSRGFAYDRLLGHKPTLQPPSKPTIQPGQSDNPFGAMPPRPQNNFLATRS